MSSVSFAILGLFSLKNSCEQVLTQSRKKIKYWCSFHEPLQKLLKIGEIIAFANEKSCWHSGICIITPAFFSALQSMMPKAADDLGVEINCSHNAFKNDKQETVSNN